MLTSFATIIVAFSAALASASPITASAGAATAQSSNSSNQKRAIEDYCKGWDIEYGSMLTATCTADDGLQRPESIDLNQCLANDGGSLVHRPGGGFAGSCGPIAVTSGYMVYADCTRPDGSSVVASIEYESFATVNNGRLSCRG
ncbi:hypothetical protein Micbo1qcDRAFT_223617 [Microdochium bolleyi]|uniref:Cyanovirin-N domain-containing protein n=1 Tax=Microdochium bolleyi TaxID=196109 RepID=A0A136IJT5_9PEZI|nr:hypothetical protein Micbo1qcDRAFT_223617 [Microdochium bolleyi]